MTHCYNFNLAFEIRYKCDKYSSFSKSDFESEWLSIGGGFELGWLWVGMALSWACFELGWLWGLWSSPSKKVSGNWYKLSTLVAGDDDRS